MDFTLSEDQRDVADLAERLFRQHGSDDRIRACYESGDPFDFELWQQLAQTGLLALTLPSADGGSGFGMVDLGLVLEQQGRFLCPVPLWRQQLAASAIALFGSDTLRRDVLPSLVDGSRVASLAAPAGSMTALRARADGTGWLLAGAMDAVVIDRRVSVLVVPAVVANGTRLFVVRPDLDGIARVDGVATNQEPVANLVFDNVRVEGDALLAPGATEAWLVERSASCIAALQLGATGEALRRAAAYVGERQQFGRPIGSFQAVAVRMADAYVQVELLRSAQWQLAWRLDAGCPATVAASVASFHASEAGHIVGHTAQHYHGGTGADLTYPVHRFFLWSRALEITAGGSERHLAILGKRLPALVGGD